MYATPGVGSGPITRTSTPSEVIPATSAFSSMYPERRVSFPSTILGRAPSGVLRGFICANTYAAARPSFNAVSAVTGSTFATPRTPSVPKIFFACVTLVIKRETSCRIKERRFTNRRLSGGRFRKRLSLFQLIDLAMQGPPADPELLRGFRDVPVGGRE